MSSISGFSRPTPTTSHPGTSSFKVTGQKTIQQQSATKLYFGVNDNAYIEEAIQYEKEILRKAQLDKLKLSLCSSLPRKIALIIDKKYLNYPLDAYGPDERKRHLDWLIRDTKNKINRLRSYLD